ncbi:MAG: fucose isomerase, partial [Gemmatimonadota bacterium]
MNTTLGVIVGNRDFFPDYLVTEARNDVQALFAKLDIGVVMLSEEDSKLGGVGTYADARNCAELFKRNRESIDGVLVSLPNFGDEKGVADTLKLAGLDVPVLVQAYPDDLDKLDPANRRDGFCGKISVTNNLYQRGIAFSLTTKHVCRPNDASFVSDLDKFIAVCRVVRGLRNARLGAVGARPGAFNTVRYSEKILERAGISVTTVDFSEILGNAEKLSADDSVVKERVEQIKAYASTGSTPESSLVKIARLDVALRDFVEANELDA